MLNILKWIDCLYCLEEMLSKKTKPEFMPYSDDFMSVDWLFAFSDGSYCLDSISLKYSKPVEDLFYSEICYMKLSLANGEDGSVLSVSGDLPDINMGSDVCKDPKVMIYTSYLNMHHLGFSSDRILSIGAGTEELYKKLVGDRGNKPFKRVKSEELVNLALYLYCDDNFCISSSYVPKPNGKRLKMARDVTGIKPVLDYGIRAEKMFNVLSSSFNTDDAVFLKSMGLVDKFMSGVPNLSCSLSAVVGGAFYLANKVPGSCDINQDVIGGILNVSVTSMSSVIKTIEM